MNWIKINPLPFHNQKCEILTKKGKIVTNTFYDSICREFAEIRNGNYCHYEIDLVDSWKDHDNIDISD